jgi:hypothetical protein
LLHGAVHIATNPVSPSSTVLLLCCLLLQDALQLDGDAAAGGSIGDADGSELEDLDDYINKLDAGAL